MIGKRNRIIRKCRTEKRYRILRAACLAASAAIMIALLAWGCFLAVSDGGGDLVGAVFVDAF